MYAIGQYGLTYAQNVQLTRFCFAHARKALVWAMVAVVSCRASTPIEKFVNSPM